MKSIIDFLEFLLELVIVAILIVIFFGMILIIIEYFIIPLFSFSFFG